MKISIISRVKYISESLNGLTWEYRSIDFEFKSTHIGVLAVTK